MKYTFVDRHLGWYPHKEFWLNSKKVLEKIPDCPDPSFYTHTEDRDQAKTWDTREEVEKEIERWFPDSIIEEIPEPEDKK